MSKEVARILEKLWSLNRDRSMSDGAEGPPASMTMSAYQQKKDFAKIPAKQTMNIPFVTKNPELTHKTGIDSDHLDTLKEFAKLRKELTLSKEGFLEKKSRNRNMFSFIENWKLRKFCLREQYLHYYKSGNETLSGTIELKDATVGVTTDLDDKKFPFFVQSKTDGALHLNALTKDERHDWMRVLQQATKSPYVDGIDPATMSPDPLHKEASDKGKDEGQGQGKEDNGEDAVAASLSDITLQEGSQVDDANAYELAPPAGDDNKESAAQSTVSAATSAGKRDSLDVESSNATKNKNLRNSLYSEL